MKKLKLKKADFKHVKSVRSHKFILWFNELGIEDVPLVGGKNASLGEMYRNLTKKGVNVPNGFAITSFAYNYFVEKAGLKERIRKIIKSTHISNVNDLAKKGSQIRELIRNASMPPELQEQIAEAYKKLSKQYNHNTDVAVRSSATAEDLPDASFAGQQETYLNIRGESALIDACKKCFASLFTNRAISYREDKKYDHFKVALSIGVQKMVRSDLASSGVMFTIDTESGFQNAVLINASWGLGENIVQGAVNPDEYYVFKPTLHKGFDAIIQKKLGTKEMTMTYSNDGNHPTKNSPTPSHKKEQFCLSDKEVMQLAKWGCIIEDWYSQKAGHVKPMDTEWAKDGATNKLFIVQARPETVQSQKDRSKIHEFVLLQKGKVLATGRSVGEKIGQGRAHVIRDVKEINQFKQGEVLITEMTDPDWEPIMKIASAIVTDKGGRTCFTGDTKILTNKGFKTMNDVFKNHEDLRVPSINRQSLKIEWKRVRAVMKRNANVMRINVSQTGRMKDNHLSLTENHKMLTINERKLVEKEIGKVLKDKEMLLVAHKIPKLNDSTEKERKLAYLLGAIMTDGSVYLSRTHGEVQLIQKPTKEKEEFISTYTKYCEEVLGKKPSISIKNKSTGLIRGKAAAGTANAYRIYSKQIALQVSEQKKSMVNTLLVADDEFIYHFLAGVIDGDGSLNKEANRVNIYCSNENLLQAITVSCLRLGIVPQITKNRHMSNVQIVEKLDQLLSYTKRVKGNGKRKTQGTRFFAAKQLFHDMVNKISAKGQIKLLTEKNLLVDAEKISKNFLPLMHPKVKKELGHLLGSDTRMIRASFDANLGMQEVFNIEVEDNHNYLVFTNKYTPILVNNCHAAIISRELGIPCVVGTNDGTKKVKTGYKVTVDCSQGENGYIYDGMLKFKVNEVDLKHIPKTRTKIMMNLGNPEQAFDTSFLPNSGVGLAREEFIINSYIKIHPLALINFNTLNDHRAKLQIEELTKGYKDKRQYFVDKLSYGIAMIGAAFYPRDVIVRLSDFKTNEYANLIGGHQFEPVEENPMIGWRGASRYYKPGYKEGFGLECLAFRKVRDEMGLTNIKIMVPFCRTVEEGKKVLAEMAKYGLKRKKNGLEVYVMCEIPSNVILADEFSKIFDGFSIGSNDLTQLTLGLDRDSQLVADIYDERNMAVKTLIAQVIKSAKANHRKIGICGQAVSDFPEFAEFVVGCGIDSISLNPDTVVKTTLRIAQTEKKMKK